MSKQFNKWLSVIKSGRFTEKEIIYFRKLLNGVAKSSLSQEQKFELMEAFLDRAPFKITREQSLKGIRYIRNQTFKLNGGMRKSSPFTLEQAEVIRHFSRFEFVGLYCVNEACGRYYALEQGYHHYLPVYRVIARDGSFFDYVPATWGEVKRSTSVVRVLKRKAAA